MSYKTILSVATQADRPALEVSLGVAAQIALRNDAHLDVMALGVDRTQVAYAYASNVGVMVQMAMEQAEAESKAIETVVNAVMAEQEPALRWSVETAVTQIGVISELVALRARFSDLVVLGRPYGPSRGLEAEAVIEAALFGGQAPVLMVPDGVSLARAPRRISIAWNQSREAMAAVRCALPLLKEAEMVTITVVAPPAHGAERSDPGGLLCQMLVRHGVKAEVSVLARTLPRVSEVLARAVRDQNADLLVMGAYGHSRFREAILGGATRAFLEAAEVPVLLAH